VSRYLELCTFGDLLVPRYVQLEAELALRISACEPP
jgi:hypothetical protein